MKSAGERFSRLAVVADREALSRQGLAVALLVLPALCMLGARWLPSSKHP